MTLLRLAEVEARYGAVRALRGISIDVPEGAIVCLIGANGAGKSTTLKAISGVVKPATGTIVFDGRSLVGLTPNQIVKLGIAQVPEGRKIFRDLTVRETLQMGAYARDDHRAVAQDIEFVFNLFPRLKERTRQLGGSLSGGEQQMLAIGRGLMAKPRLLLLDEPSLGLAPIIIADIFTTLRQINKEQRTTLLIVEQSAHMVLKNATFGYVLQVGRVAVEGSAEDLQRRKEVVDSYLGIQH
ncbi:MAG: ABC transporter ATP-binding protein [Rhodospirillales bacterium]|nr:ABC transporter ATP-binding protein [Rhodospirillales bacterium]